MTPNSTSCGGCSFVKVVLPIQPEDEARFHVMNQAVQAGISLQEVAEHVSGAIRNEKFNILTHPASNPWIEKRISDILQNRNPS